MSKTERSRKLLFSIAAALVLLTTVWHIYSNFTHYSYGMLLKFNSLTNFAIIQEIIPGSPADNAGLKTGDTITVVNSHILNIIEQDCRDCFSQEMRTGKLNLEVSRKGEIFQAEVTGDKTEVRTRFIAFLAIGLLYMLMGTWVFFARPNYIAATTWAFFALLMGGYVVRLGSSQTNYEFFSLIISSLVVGQFFFSSAAGLHFALVFPKITRLAKRKWIVPTIYAIPAIIMFFIVLVMLFQYFFAQYLPFLDEIPTVIGVLITSYWLLYLGLIIVTLIRTYLRTTEPTEKRRIRAIIFGTVVPLLFLLLIIFMFSVFGVEIPNSSVVIFIILAIIPVTYFYAIVRHRAMQMQIILKKGLIYSMVTGAVLLFTGISFVAVFGLMLLLQDLLPSLGRQGGTFYTLATDENIQKFTIAVWSVAVGATFGIIKGKVQNFVDRRFYRERYSYRQALKKLTSVLEQTHDRQKMMAIVIKNAEEIVHPRSVAIVVVQPEATGIVEHAVPEAMEQIRLKYDSMEALKVVFGEGRRFIGMRELNEESFEQGELIHATLMRLGADICLPMKVERGILGYILLGKKRSETSYNLEELELLTLLADQAALGVEHMNLAQDAAEKEKFKRELEIGRKMQQSLLPSTVPFIPGLEIAALNVPAMEVGGDFYTFVEYNQQKLGVIAGDIVGKGVAGALNMAATISSLRLIAEESASVSEAMQRLNRYLVKNSDKRSFAAVVVGMVELDKKVFRWSNGGLPDPILIPEKGDAVFLEAELYPLPPGASAHSAYTELQQKLDIGDTVVLVSDGAIEVRPDDGSDRVFGYQRLLQFLSENSKRGLTDLLDALSRKIHEYRGAIQLEDDFTVVAFRLRKPK